MEGLNMADMAVGADNRIWTHVCDRLNMNITHPSLITRCMIIVVIVFTFLQLLDARSEYPFFLQQRIEGWYIHHDEKLIVPDARYFFLQGAEDVDIYDYKPYTPHPISATFGIAGPALATFGFKIFGMNNVGLRAFFIILSGLSSLLCVLSLLRVFPGVGGILFSIVYLFNYSNFVLTRHAVPENILTLFLTGIMWLYLSRRDFFLRNIRWIGFGSAMCLLFKPNYVLYVYLLILIIAFVEKVGFRRTQKLLLWSLAGMVIIEGVHMMVLYQMGIAQWRYYNLLAVLKLHSGSNLGLLQSFQPGGVQVFLRYPIMLAEWYGMPKGLLMESSLGVGRGQAYMAMGLAFAALLVYGLIRGLHKVIPRPGLVIVLFMVGYLAISSGLFFYLKRAVSLFPLTLILLSLVSHQMIDRISASPKKRCLATLLLISIVMVQLASQIWIIAHLPGCRADEVQNNSIALDSDLPKGSVIYAHCYGYRFFWQVKDHRMMSADDQHMNNQMVVDWAIKERGKYVLLSGRGGSVYPNVLEMFRRLKLYSTTETVSDSPDYYALYEIAYQ